MTTLTLDEAQQRHPDAVEKALKGEEVAIKVGRDTVRLVHDVPMRPPGYFAECYRDAEDAAFEGRVCAKTPKASVSPSLDVAEKPNSGVNRMKTGHD
jgi:hypothetical protein